MRGWRRWLAGALARPSLLDVAGSVLAALGGVMLALWTGLLVHFRERLDTLVMDPQSRHVSVVCLASGLFLLYLGVGMRRRWRLPGLIVFVFVLHSTVGAVLDLVGAIALMKPWMEPLFSLLLWLLISQQASRHFLVDLVLAVPGLEDRLRARFAMARPRTTEVAVVTAVRARMSFRAFWNRYVLGFSGLALIFEVVKNLELCDGFLKSNKLAILLGLFLLPLAGSLLAAFVVRDEEAGAPVS